MHWSPRVWRRASAPKPIFAGLVAAQDCEMLAVSAEDGGNPVIGLVELLRERATPQVSRWVHRGLTSQDVLDTGLMLATRAVARRGDVPTRRTDFNALGACDNPPRHADGGPYPDSARGAHDVRDQSRDVAATALSTHISSSPR